MKHVAPGQKWFLALSWKRSTVRRSMKRAEQKHERAYQKRVLKQESQEPDADE